jgi:hypothetical protein
VRFVRQGPAWANRDLRASWSPFRGSQATRGTQGASSAESLAAPAQFSTATPNFDGIATSGIFPPDTNGDVGPNHYVQMVNVRLNIYDKTGDSQLPGNLPININSLWSGFGGLCQTTNRGDPIVLYDPLANRWLISQFAFAVNASGNPITPFEECIAISQGPNPVTGGWFLYDFNIHPTKFNDYPKLGVWPDAYYMTANQAGAGGNTGAWAFDRTQMLAGLPATFQYVDLTTEGFLLPSDLDGATPPPAGSPNYFARFQEGGGADRLEIFEFHVDWGTPALTTFTGPTVLNTTAFDSSMCAGFLPSEQCIPQPGTTQGLATLADRLMWRLAYRNFGTHETLVANHTVDVDGTDHAGVRWYELRRTGGVWSIFQQGDVAPDATHRWMGSIAMDRDGNMALGYAISSGTTFPGVRYTGRLAGDPVGTMPQGEFTLQAGAGSQTACQAVDLGNDGTIDFCRGRYGDYSAMSVDPVDDCTFWYTQEYVPASGAWRTRIGAFRFCNDAPVADADGPYTTVEGADVGLDGTGSSDPNPTDALTYEWDLDNDGSFETVGASPTFDLVGQDGVFPVTLRVTDSVGASDTDTTTVTVDNVAPTVTLAQDGPWPENSAVTVSGTVSDPGWLEPLTATIDWGDGTPVQPVVGTLENLRPDATLTFSMQHVYGDNGTFTVKVCGSDDDTTTCETIPVTFTNVDPTAQIDETNAVDVNGTPVFIIEAGDPTPFDARSTDPGSDDLSMNWDFDDGPPAPDDVLLSLVNPPNPDPPDSPTIQPRDVTFPVVHTFDQACAYEPIFSVIDDDGGTGFDSAIVLATGEAERARPSGWWASRYDGQVGGPGFDDITLECYLQIAGVLSDVFHEVVDASTIPLAHGVLAPTPGGDPRHLRRLDRELLTLWLNVANGGLGYGQLVVDADGDGVLDTTVGEVAADAEAVRLDPASTRAEIDAARRSVHEVNQTH